MGKTFMFNTQLVPFRYITVFIVRNNISMKLCAFTWEYVRPLEDFYNIAGLFWWLQE